MRRYLYRCSLSLPLCVCVCTLVYIYIYNCGEFNHILIRFFVIEGRILYPSHVFLHNLFFLIKKIYKYKIYVFLFWGCVWLGFVGQL